MTNSAAEPSDPGPIAPSTEPAASTNSEPFVEWWLAMRHTAALLDRQAEEAVRQATGLNLSLFAVLRTLDTENDCLKQQDIATLLSLTKSTISRLVDAALAERLVEPDPAPHSRRERRIRLTDAGRSSVRAADDAICAVQLQAAAQFTRTELDRTVTATRKLAEVLATTGATLAPKTSA
ncbi:MarR family transcriptional regulator [Cryobacterium lactosi]|uniref:MarR family transcriptional regulator n=1 Tax=Cryobacterium lactosi TaxID=1259202 RepID=A0A4R9BJT2_9MICO|nr:MarR family transcriptional regulator [Cryobacterium lactosi]TFD85838.1 MarR family transcriptional regulator [Cryobacterium lactosi]